MLTSNSAIKSLTVRLQNKKEGEGVMATKKKKGNSKAEAMRQMREGAPSATENRPSKKELKKQATEEKKRLAKEAKEAQKAAEKLKREADKAAKKAERELKAAQRKAEKEANRKPKTGAL